jgi:hypothetical protein
MLMKFYDYSHRHGKALVEMLHPEEYHEIIAILSDLDTFPHGKERNQTPVTHISKGFNEKGWKLEKQIPMSSNKSDYCDIYKNKVYIEQEYSKFETLFRDFFRFLLLHDIGELDVGIVICYDESAFKHWGKGVGSHKASRATLQRATDFLKGSYGTVVRVPVWVIGIE